MGGGEEEGESPSLALGIVEMSCTEVNNDSGGGVGLTLALQSLEEKEIIWFKNFGLGFCSLAFRFVFESHFLRKHRPANWQSWPLASHG